MHAWKRVLDPNCSCNCTIAPSVAQMQPTSTKMRRQSLPCNTNQVSFDAKILHNLSYTQQTFIQYEKISPKYWAHVQSTSSNPWQSPHNWVGYNFVPQCLPNHTQPMGRCQKKLKGDRSIDQSRNCLKNSLGKTFNYLTLLWCTL